MKPASDPAATLPPAELLKARLHTAIDVKRRLLEQDLSPVLGAAEALITSLRGGGGILVFGNGGSAADAQHIVGELQGRFYAERRALRAEALSANTSTLTALANDYDYTMVFARQIEANGRPGDIAWGLSTSGNSPNVIKALEAAKQRGLITVGFTGEGGGRMATPGLCDYLVTVPSRDTPRIQEAHQVLYHTLCEIVERAFTET